MKKKISFRLFIVTLLTISCFGLTGCEISAINSGLSEMKGSITGNTYQASFYSNDGEKFMTMSGENIDMKENIVRESTYADGSWGYTETKSSVITITIDGSEMSSCGSTIIFAEEGLEPDIDYVQQDIESRADGSLGDYTFVANRVNRYKNMLGKPVVVVIQSQLGDPICAYSGEKVYYKVCEDLPKTTMLYIDGKLLYIHRANFQIIDKELLD